MEIMKITDEGFIGPLPYWKDMVCTEHVYARSRNGTIEGQPMRATSAYSTKKCRCAACKMAKKISSHEFHWGNREKILERKRKYNKDNREKKAAYNRKYREENHEAYLAYHRKYREENRDKRLESKRKYREENRDKISEYDRMYSRSPAGKAKSCRHRLKRRSTDQDFYDSMTQEEHARFCEISEYFHPVIETHVDHVIPVSLGGTSHPDNLAVLTAHENVIKNDKHPGEWYYCTVPLLGKYRVDQN